MPKDGQPKSEARPKYPGLWGRITTALKTEKTGEIAELLGVKPSSVSEWKRKKDSGPSLRNLSEIARLGNTSVEELLYGNEAKPKSEIDASTSNSAELAYQESADEFEKDTNERLFLISLRDMITEIAHQVARDVARQEIALSQGHKLQRPERARKGVASVPSMQANINDFEQGEREGEREQAEDGVQQRPGRRATGGGSKH